MALFLLGILFLFILIGFIASVFVILYDKGQLYRNKHIFIIITLYSFILNYISYIALPTNYILQKNIILLTVFISIIAIGLYFYKPIKDIKINLIDISKLLIIFSLIINIVVMSI